MHARVPVIIAASLSWQTGGLPLPGSNGFQLYLTGPDLSSCETHRIAPMRFASGTSTS